MRMGMVLFLFTLLTGHAHGAAGVVFKEMAESPLRSVFEGAWGGEFHSGDLRALNLGQEALIKLFLASPRYFFTLAATCGDFGKVPPNDVVAARIVIVACLQSKHTAVVAQVVNKLPSFLEGAPACGCFFRWVHELIFILWHEQENEDIQRLMPPYFERLCSILSTKKGASGVYRASLSAAVDFVQYRFPGFPDYFKKKLSSEGRAELDRIASARGDTLAGGDKMARWARSLHDVCTRGVEDDWEEVCASS